jgi:hypothetical protein
MRAYIVVLLSVIGATPVTVACSGGTDCESGPCGAATANDGSDGAAVTPSDATPPGCDRTKEQKDQDACLNVDFAIFVAPTGRPDSPGTKAAPVNTLARAFELAGGAKQRVFVCDGTYDERVTLKAPLSIYGALTCAGGVWKASTSHAVFGKSQETGFGLDVVKVAGEFELVDLEFGAAPGTSAAPNSIAARVVASPGLVLKRVTLTAGQGAEGATGDGGQTGVRTPMDGKGLPGTMGAGGGPKACACTVGGPTSGGNGGGPANGGGLAGTGDAVGTPPTDGQGSPGGITTCIGGIGHEGASATNQAPALPGDKFGTLAAEDWVPAAGVDGKAGGSGQGGGGGGANNGGGGGGGCGGCGGSGGKGGKGGGASVALLALASPVTLTGSVLKTGQGGKGGKGGAAGPGGAPGGSGSPGSGTPNNGCPGGQGGRGGDGGHGSGGPGGVAIAILHEGAAPIPGSSQIVQAGQPGPGGEAAAAGANAGPDGKQLPIANVSDL